MGVAYELPPPPSPFGGENARRHGRVRCVAVKCDAGDVLDLSASGAKVRWRGWLRARQGEQIRVTISGLAVSVTVDARIVWLQRLGWRRHELGLEFGNVDQPTREALCHLARRAPVVNDSIERTAT